MVSLLTPRYDRLEMNSFLSVESLISEISNYIMSKMCHMTRNWNLPKNMTYDMYRSEIKRNLTCKTDLYSYNKIWKRISTDKSHDKILVNFCFSYF